MELLGKSREMCPRNMGGSLNWAYVMIILERALNVMSSLECGHGRTFSESILETMSSQRFQASSYRQGVLVCG